MEYQISCRLFPMNVFNFFSEKKPRLEAPRSPAPRPNSEPGVKSVEAMESGSWGADPRRSDDAKFPAPAIVACRPPGLAVR